MKAKKLLTVALLLFVAAAVVTLAIREGGSKDSLEAVAESSADTRLPVDGLVAYYFHGEIRCPTCQKIESYAHEAIRDGFPEELNSGKLVWRVLNYEMPAHAHFATEYDIVAPTVVLVRAAQGQSARWRNLIRVWELVGDKEAFVNYVQEQTREMLAMPGG